MQINFIPILTAVLSVPPGSGPEKQLFYISILKPKQMLILGFLILQAFLFLSFQVYSQDLDRTISLHINQFLI
jgi:hypothetical protein